MRIKKRQNGLIAQAIAGTHVVLLGWDIEVAALKKGILGFAIQRTDHTEGESYWLRGTKTFPDTTPPLAPGGDASSHDQPVQSFQWGDYTAKASHRYTYRLVPMYGAPGALTDGHPIELDVETEEEWSKPHSVFFNRGAIASQEYARKFQNKKPSEVGQPAYEWLSRGLLEAIIAFIKRAKDASFGLRGAFYEFQWKAVLDELGSARERHVDVQIVFDAIDNAAHDPVDKNEEAIADAGIGDFCGGFVNGKLMHNKFLVLTRNGKPVSVWTGSTNLTENGLFGHLNCGHAVDDKRVAQGYLDYWNELKADPGAAALRKYTGQNTPTPPNPPAAGTTLVFSPQKGLATLNRYGDLADRAQHGLFMTFAFGMSEVFHPVYEKDDEVLRFALMEKEGNGAGLAKAKEYISKLRKRPNVVVAVGHNIVMNEFDRWLKEISSAVANANVRWVHTKFMLVDPLSDEPIVVVGSANFSAASTDTNEENMLVIRGDTRVADIYLGEFMRSFAHYAFREAVYIHTQQGGREDDWKPQFLATDAAWLDRYGPAGSAGDLKRRYFSGR